MSLTAGTRLGPYQIIGPLGSGGMGEVYRARDTKLGRDVALKILPEGFAHDPDRVARFRREAQMLASLNHPNIAAIYGLEESGPSTTSTGSGQAGQRPSTVRALVMELVEGLTLAERIAHAPIPIAETLPIARQIAEALEAAHEQGIIHRDLKPANIKVRADGTVKVLDFGLAKALEPAGAMSPGASMSPTITTPAHLRNGYGGQAMTEAGMILGTAAYMAPEQARGTLVDKRADLWALGVVLWEMLTGTRLFEGATVSDTLAAVLTREPDWTTLPADTPAPIRRLCRRCLTKDRKRRLADAADARLEIEDAIDIPASGERSGLPVAAPLTVRRRALVWAVAVAATLIAAVAAWTLKPSPLRPVSRLTITLPPGDRLAGLDLPALALSPDGSRLVYVATRDGAAQQLYIRAMDSLDAKPIPGTEGATTPFFSPDGQWVGFFAGPKLKKISLSGGAALLLGDAVNPRGASWSAQGTIAFGPTNSSGLLRVSEGGGTSQLLKQVGSRNVAQRWPDFLPGGDALLFSGGAQVLAHSVETGEQRIVLQQGTYARYARSGHLVYAQGGSLMAAPFDPKRLEVTRTAVPVVEGVWQTPATGSAQYSVSNTGTLAYVSGGIRAAQLRLVWVTRQGAEQPIAAPARSYLRPRLSPDGRRVAVSIQSQIWVHDLVRETLTRLTFEGATNTFPLWTPDGRRIVFDSNKEGPLNLFWQLADGSGGRERIAASQYTQAAQSWSADGQRLAYSEINDVSGYDIWVLRLRDHKAEPFLRTPSTESAPTFSPDGRWLAYQSNETGRDEIYVQPYPGPGGKWQVSTDGGAEPMWNPNGRELFYRDGNRMTAVDVTTQPAFVSGRPRLLFAGHYEFSPYPFANYDVTADGQRFLMLKASEEEQAATQITVVLNWFTELKAKVPMK